MRGELDDALARLRRWNEVRERLDERAGRTPDPGRDGAFDEPGPAAPPISPAAPGSAGSPSPAPYARLTSPAAPSVPLPVIPAPSRQPSPTSPPEPASASPPAAPAARVTSRSAVSTPAPAHGEPRTPDVVEEVLDAIGEIVLRHRQLAVTVTVDDSGTAWTAHLVFGDDGGLSVTRMEPRTFSTLSGGPRPPRPVSPAPSSPAPSSPAPSSSAPSSPAPSSPMPSSAMPSSPVPDDPETSDRTASRLAELIRRDPSLLDPPRDLPR